jgi:nucleoid DNA-binding protein
MRNHLGLLLGVSGLALAIAAPVHSQKIDKDETLLGQLAKSAKLSEDHANRFFNALGPAIQAELQRGREVNVPGLGTFRVVQIEEHRDLRDGRPVIVAATNTVEFIPSVKVAVSANSPSAKPEESVPPFQYIVLPGQTPSQRAAKTRAPTTRTR